MEGLSAYIPEDRRQAMARGEPLPDRTDGAALFADLSGFTPMTEALTRAYGPHRGAEELTRQLGLVFGALIHQVDAHRGAVIGFSGDAITCWFDGDDGLRATAASLAMQRAMEAFSTIPLAGGETASLRVKTAVAVGPVRRFLVGDPDIQLIDAVAGDTLDLLAEAERLTESGEVVVSEAVGRSTGSVEVREWRAGDGRSFAVVEGIGRAVPARPWPQLADDAIPEHDLASWVLPGVYERLRQGLGAFLADFRPAAALFLSFHGIDYDDDDGAGAKLDRFVRWVQARIAAYEGSLIQLTIGDKGSSYLYASFGAPIAHDDDAARAVAVALEIQSLAPGLEFVRDLRIGVTHGQMYAGAYGSASRRTYGVLGAKTNLSARLMGKAAPGQILCDEEIARRARKTFVFTSLGTIQVKGKQEGVPTYSPEGRVGAATAHGDVTADGPLIGRGGDLAVLEDVLNGVVAGEGRVSFLEGEAGIGKTRLVRALVERVRTREVTVLLGAGQSGAQQLPYRVWRDVFSGMFGLTEGQAASERAARVTDHVTASVPELAEHAPLLNDVLPIALPESPLTSGLDQSARQEALTSLLIALLQQAAARGPLVIVLEDAHWLDSLSWELAERIARRLLAEQAPIWLVIVHRPLDEQHVGARASSALHALPQSDVLQLGALGPEELVALVAARLGLHSDGVPGAVADLVRDRANGNPFIVEELLQTLQDQELLTLEIEGGELVCRVSPALALGRFSLPDTLQGLILSRIDRLPADRQLVLKVASVIGRLFTLSPLRDTLGQLGWAERSLRPSLLRDLTRGGFVLPEALEPELSYLFRHIITHDVVYLTLLFSQRRQVHQALAEWYEATSDDPERELAPVLAHHWSRAAEGSDSEHVVEKAISYLKAAGAQALQLGAFPEALATFERAVALLPDTAGWRARRANLLIHVGVVLERTGDYAVAKVRLQEGLDLARAVDDAAEGLRALMMLARIEQQQGNFPQAERFLEEALAAVVDGDAERSGLASIWEGLGMLAAHMGNTESAIERLEAAHELHEAGGNFDGVTAVLNNLGIVAFIRSDFGAARDYFERALSVAREQGDRERIGMFLGNLGQTAENLKEYAEARRYLREALEIARELDARPVIYDVLVGLAHVSVAMDQDEEAGAGYRSALQGAVEIGALPLALAAVCGLAALDRRAGRWQDAARRLGFILAHPAYSAEIALRAEPLLEELRRLLGEAELAAAVSEGESGTMEHEVALVAAG
jgi:adenylate cyclase